MTQPNQIAHLDMADFKTALVSVPEEQREALILVGACGFSYDEAAQICGCAVGTIKSRVNRARKSLADTLGVHEPPQEEQSSEPPTSARLGRLSLPLKQADLCRTRRARGRASVRKPARSRGCELSRLASDVSICWARPITGCALHCRKPCMIDGARVEGGMV